MSKAFVKKEILDFLAKDKTEQDQALNLNALFHTHIIFWNPGQQAYVESAITELIKENILRPQGEKYLLTKTGFDLIYPPLNDFVKDTVLNWFEKNHSKEGDTLDVHALYLKHTLNWTPKQNSAFETGLKKLTNEGLIEIKNGSVTLTKHGFEAINKSVYATSHS